MAGNITTPESAGRKQLMDDAVRLAESGSPEDLAALSRKLGDASFLDALDSREDYEAPPTGLRIAKVMQTLAQGGAPAAQAVLVGLTRKPAFLAARPRQQLLILALVDVRPAPPDAIGFWREHAQPGSILKHVTVGALADNGSEPAVQLLGSILADPGHRERDRVLWMQDAVLRHRTELPLLRVCDRLVRETLDGSLRLRLLEALTDYRPDEWYLECDPPEPDLWAAAPEDSRRMMEQLCGWALGELPLDPRLAASVKSTLAIVARKGAGRQGR